MLPTIHVFKGPSMEHLWPGYFCQVLFSCFLGPLCQMRSGHCYITIWLFCQVKFSCLQNCQVHIAQFSSERCQGHIPKSAQCYSALWPLCRIANFDSPCGLTSEWLQVATDFLFSGLSNGRFFWSAQNLFPDCPCFFVFFHSLPSAPHFSPAFSLSWLFFCFFDLIGLWILREMFSNSNHHLNYFLDILGEIEWFWLQT